MSDWYEDYVRKEAELLRHKEAHRIAAAIVLGFAVGMLLLMVFVALG